MQKPLFKKPETPNFSNPAAQKAFVEDIRTTKELLLKELDLNRAEQTLLKQRIAIMKSFINDLPASDPQYGMMLIQSQMDQVEMDELKVRESAIVQQIEIV